MKLISFLKYLHAKYIQDEVPSLTAQTSYYLLLAFIPFLIFILTVIGNLNLPAENIYSYLSAILPKQTYILLASILNEILVSNPFNIFSILLTLFFASKGMKAVIIALNKAYGENENRSILHLWTISFIFTIIFAFILIFSLFALVFGKLIGKTLFTYLNLYYEFIIIWEYLRYIITIGLMIIIFTFIYRHAPNCKLYVKDVIIGAIFTTISWTFSSQFFAHYINNYNSSYTILYGSLGGIFLLLIWLYLTSTIIIIGGEINAYLYNMKNSK